MQWILVDVLNWGGECNEDSIFAVQSYGVNDMDVLVKYSERRCRMLQAS